jgi:predicted peptidase
VSYGAAPGPKVFGDGQKLIAVAVEYDQDIDTSAPAEGIASAEKAWGRL